jgi:hypothetical protein
MKNRIIKLMLLASIYINTQAQDLCQPYTSPDACQNGNGISTDPDNLVNDDCPELKNAFEWRLRQPQGGGIIDEDYKVYDGDGIPRNIRNPFNDPTITDYSYLVNNHNSNYHPEDG